MLTMAMAGWMAATLAAEPVTLTRLDGTIVQGTWAASATPGTLVVRQGATVLTTGVDELLDARFGRSAAAFDDHAWPHVVWWRNGTTIPGTLSDDGGSVQTSWGTVAGDPRALRAVHWRRHDCGAAVRKELRDNGTTDVMLTWRDGAVSRFAGTLEELTGVGGRFTYRERTVAFDAERVGGVVLASGAVPTAPVCLEMANDYRVCGRLVETTATTAVVAVTNDARLTVPLELVGRLQCASDRVVYVSDLEPTRTLHRDFFEEAWPVRFDRSVTNRPMRMRGRPYARGLGVHAHSEVTFPVPDGARVFAATIGIDDGAAAQGEVLFRVLKDGGEERFGPLGRHDPPQTVQVDVAGSPAVTLIVERAGGLDIGDQANWAAARFIR